MPSVVITNGSGCGLRRLSSLRLQNYKKSLTPVCEPSPNIIAIIVSLLVVWTGNAIFVPVMDINTLTIGFDAKRAATNNTGLGNYSRLVIDVLSEKIPHPELRLYTPLPSRAGERVRPLLSRPGVSLIGPSSAWGRRVSGLWRVYGGLASQLRADGVNLFHGLSNELPLDIHKAGIPSVVTIHDAIFRRCPDNYKPVDRWIYDNKWRRAIAAATRIIAISECTRRDIIELYGADPGKIDIVYQGCDPIFSTSVSADDISRIRVAYSLPDRFISCVGTVEPRKNQLLPVRALSALPADVSLVIVGRGREPYASQVMAEARNLGVADRVIMLENIPFRDIPAVYAASLFASYTSRYEGFGLPVIEAISSGVPVIAAVGSCLEEAGGPGALYVDPDDTVAFVEAAVSLIDNQDIRREMVAAGRKYVARFSRENFSKGLIDSYSRAIEDFSRVERLK